MDERLPTDEDLAWMRDFGNDLHKQAAMEIVSRREQLCIKDEQIAGLRTKVEKLGRGIARANKAIGARNRKNAAMGQEVERLKGVISARGAQSCETKAWYELANFELGRLRHATKQLVEQLDLINNDEQYKAVWICFSNHGGRYSGPTYTISLENARKVLGALGRKATDCGEPED